MKKIILLFSFLFVINFMFGNKAKKYYAFVNKAEKYIINEKYQKAINTYDKAFRYNNPFFTDIKNALQCALIDTNCNVAIVQNIIQYYEMQYSHFTAKNIFAKSDLVKKINEKYKITIKDTNMLNKSICVLLSNCFERDGDIRNWSTKECGEIYKGWCNDSILKIDQLNIDTILYLYQNYTINPYTASNKGMSAIDLNNLHYRCIKNHNNNKILVLDSVLYQQVLFGNYDNRKYIYNYGRCVDTTFGNIDYKTKYGSETMILNDAIYYKKDKKVYKAIDKNRKKIFADTYMNFIKKVCWQYNHEDLGFVFGTSARLIGISREDVQKVIDLDYKDYTKCNVTPINKNN